MVKIDSVTLENVTDIIPIKRRLLVDKPRAQTDISIKNVPTGYGREWEIRGGFEGTRAQQLTKETNLFALADDDTHILDFEDGSSTKTVIVMDPETVQKAGETESLDYLMYCVAVS